ncbi:hypothetical protein PGH12_12090 [Chryseobacterium wangxinyae]|uniref:hypothetical protein n=1 Tax=Chryseobacterium sp. CY350 TaxID=2997336 RepID=UPI002271FAA3|nr:hypothetical protein [Chryseobacterium sp. CY350]MCY0976188.1 hypothetical protein [Chryseobacterium sp. CY350]WBZ94214.1 hypothetical protein PGH12_12090 [Chryseobacterium sp. CY350]
MKKLLFTSLLALGLLLPATFSASTNYPTSKTEILTQKQKKKKTKKRKARKSKSTANRGCTYNGHTLYVGERGGCYYMAGSSKEYVDRSYCSGCN